MKATGWVIVSLVMFAGIVVKAESIMHGTTTIDMDFVHIGHAGNAADQSGYGAVDYNYQIGTFEVTEKQWTSVVNADSRVENTEFGSGLGTTWFEAARFCNWLTSGDAYSGAYDFDANGVLVNVDRSGAISTYKTVYVLPTENEWHKAAYFRSDDNEYTLYATGNSVPVAGIDARYGNSPSAQPWLGGTGSRENNGTYDMGGNLWEWNESAADGILDDMMENRAVRGGSYSSSVVGLSSSFRHEKAPAHSDIYDRYGFRVAAIPEPSVAGLMAIFGGGIVFVRRFFSLG